MIDRLRAEVSALHAELVRYGLVVWTAGNISARVPGEDLFVIKPSGVSYDELTPAQLVVCDLDGTLVEGDLAPSSDTAAHAHVYREMPHVGGVVHTHSTYACAWAARAEPVPCVLTAMADEFGGEIPLGPFARIGDDSIGRGVVDTLSGHRSPAVIMANHGVFAIGRDAKAAVKAAVMCEDVARTTHIARQLGPLVAIPADDVDALFDRYQNVYGQQGGPRMNDVAGGSSALKQVWFLTGSQGLYGEDTLAQVAAQSREVAKALDASGLPVEVVWCPVLTDAGGIEAMMLAANADPRCVGVTAWMHTFSPARMWIHGLDALRKPLLHLHTQAQESLPWATIDMDFMNLNQAAHGDREFGYIQARLGVVRKVVAGHVTDPVVRARIAAWSRAALGWSEVRSLRLARFGDTMRDVAVTEGDRTEAQWRWGVTVNPYAVTDLADAVHAALDSEVDRLVGEYAQRYDVAPELRRGADRHGSLRYGARIELGLRALLEASGSKAFTTNFEDLGALRQLPGLAVQRLMEDGYGFAGEGDWKTAMLLRTLKAAATDLPGGTSFMEDYTYHLGPGPQRILGAHMLEVCPSIAAATPRIEVHPLGIGGREDPVRMVFDAAPGPGVVVGMSDVGDRFRLVANEIRVVTADEPLPNLPVARAVWEPAPNLRTSTEAWILAGAPHHTVLSTALGVEEIDDLAEMARTELLVIDADTTPRRFVRELRWNQAYHRLAGSL